MNQTFILVIWWILFYPHMTVVVAFLLNMAIIVHTVCLLHYQAGKKSVTNYFKSRDVRRLNVTGKLYTLIWFFFFFFFNLMLSENWRKPDWGVLRDPFRHAEEFRIGLHSLLPVQGVIEMCVFMCVHLGDLYVCTVPSDSCIAQLVCWNQGVFPPAFPCTDLLLCIVKPLHYWRWLLRGDHVCEGSRECEG